MGEKCDSHVPCSHSVVCKKYVYTAISDVDLLSSFPREFNAFGTLAVVGHQVSMVDLEWSNASIVLLKLTP
jgi:hypothetical protein